MWRIFVAAGAFDSLGDAGGEVVQGAQDGEDAVFELAVVEVG